MGDVNRIFVATRGGAGNRLLSRLQQCGHFIAAVATITQPRHMGDGIFLDLLRKQKRRVFSVAELKKSEFAAVMQEMRVDTIVSLRCPVIIHSAVIDAASIGALNAHSGPLPEIAGAAAPSWGIILGRNQHALTVHRMIAEVDAGQILSRHDFPIGDDTTAIQILTACVNLAVEHLPGAVSKLASCPRNVANHPSQSVNWYPSEPPNGAWIDWRQPALTISRLVRACDYGPWPSPWGMARTLYREREIAFANFLGIGQETSIQPGTVVACQNDYITIACEDRTIELRLSDRDNAGKPTPPIRSGETFTSHPDVHKP
jgi:methionyl-tRNA formyltransferase